MDTDFIALVSFVLITTFTPGPNNISSASMGVLYGYKKTLGYLLGIATGFFLIMLLCSWISSVLLQSFPSFESILRIIGALYILWLAYHTFKASFALEQEGQKILGFTNGFFLQLLNPKAIVYGLTIYSTFLSGIANNYFYRFVSALVFMVLAFCSISIWTLFGATISNFLNRPRMKQAINAVLSLLLVYTAVELSGLLELFSNP
ncbi:MAG: LysE family translocator [Anaerolineales bacterium]|nr:LysE family translocator [Anaerolineales bacterium]